jgi:Tfp pilus assembly protein PilV
VRPRGFSLVETLIAGMILSGAVLTLGAISTNALTATRLNRHYAMAAALLDRQLHLIDFVGIDSFTQTGQMDGVIEDFEPGYQWHVTTEYQGTDSLYIVTITMTWMEGKRPYHLTVQTMLDGTGIAAETGTETTTTETGAPPTQP